MLMIQLLLLDVQALYFEVCVCIVGTFCGGRDRCVDGEMLKVARPIFDEGENSVHFYGKSPS